MNLWAISDLHLGHHINRAALDSIEARPDDWLILAGDVCESESQFAEALAFLSSRFAKLIWVPGNHELWCTSPKSARGEARYTSLVTRARALGVLTPEDPYPVWPGSQIVIAPLFTLYDYSFRPHGLARDNVVEWAAADGVISADELLLHSDPYPDRAAWCAARVESTAARLAQIPANHATILVNHYPLKRAHASLPRNPRFAPWCGTRLTANWHRRFHALAVVYGHVHVRRTFVQDAVRFHEVSLGYPSQWDQSEPIDTYVRQIL